MATVDLAEDSASLSVIFQNPLQNMFRTDNTILSMIPVEYGRGAVWDFDAKFTARTAGGAYAEGADMDASDYDAHSRKKGSINWAQYRTGARISGLAYANAGDNLLYDEVADAGIELVDILAAEVYGGDETGSPIELGGLARAIDATGAYAGFNPATSGQEAWTSVEDTMALADLTTTTLYETLLRPVKDACGQMPHAVFCNGDILDALAATTEDGLLATQYTTAPMSIGPVVASKGVRFVNCHGVPVIEDKHATASTAYAINFNYLRIRQVPSVMSPDAVARIGYDRIAARVQELTGNPDMTARAIEQQVMARQNRLTPEIEALAKNGDSISYMVKIYLQMLIKRRNAFGKCTFT